jgi:hypothetical protein
MKGGVMSTFSTVLIAVISAVAGYVVSKIRERQTNWRNLKFEFYKEFISAHSGMVDEDATDNNRIEFSRSCNRIALVASTEVLNLLNAYLSEISISNPSRRVENEIELRKKLIWAMRRDIGYLPSGIALAQFNPPFQTSGNRRSKRA